MSDEKRPSLEYRVVKKILTAIILLFLFFVILNVGAADFLIETPIRFFFGWAIHAWKEIPPLFGKWQAVILPLGCLLLAGVIAHRFVRRWMVGKKPGLNWRAKYTAAVMALLLLFSAAAIATSGVFHQFFWLASGRVIESDGSLRRSGMNAAITNGRQLMMLVLMFHKENGRYPTHFEELDEEDNDLSRFIWIDADGGSALEPFVLLKPGFSGALQHNEPILLSPLLNNGSRAVVAYANGSVQVVSSAKLKLILSEIVANADE